MNVIESSTNGSLSNLTPEFKRSVGSKETTDNVNVNKLGESNKEYSASLSEQTKEVSQAQLTPQQLDKVAQQLQDFVGDMNRGLVFSVDKDSGRDVIKVIDKNSGDLVKQFPSEEVLTLVAKLSEMVGGFVDAKV